MSVSVIGLMKSSISLPYNLFIKVDDYLCLFLKKVFYLNVLSFYQEIRYDYARIGRRYLKWEKEKYQKEFNTFYQKKGDSISFNFNFNNYCIIINFINTRLLICYARKAYNTGWRAAYYVHTIARMGENVQPSKI